MGGTKSVGPMWPHWENQLTKAKRAGVIEGLERAKDIADRLIPTNSAWVVEQIRFEIERLRAEQKEG